MLKEAVMICSTLNFCYRSIPVFLFWLMLLVPGSVSAVDRTLTLQNSGAGSGNINGSVSYLMDPGASYPATMAEGTSVTLTQIPDWKSLFDGWGAPCIVTDGVCTFTLNSDVTLSANFSLNKQAVIVSGHSIVPEYATLTDAYAAASALIPSTISANVNTFYEPLTLSRPIFVKFYLGREPGAYFSQTPVGLTTLVGDLTINDGSAEVDALAIKGNLVIGQGSVWIKSLIIM